MTQDKELDEFIEVTKQLAELQQKIVPIYNKQQILLVKLRKKWKEKSLIND